MPVLTIEAIESTRLVEDSEIRISEFRFFGIREIGIPNFAAGRTDPTGHTVGGQRVVIPGDVTLRVRTT